MQSSASTHPKIIRSCNRNTRWLHFHSCNSFHVRGKGARMQPTTFADGHTASNARDLFRPPKLSGVGPGQYWGGGPPKKPLGCCQLLIFFACSEGNDSRAPCQTLGRGNMRMPGVEPGSQAWEACMIPLHYMRQYQHAPTPELSMRQRVADYADPPQLSWRLGNPPCRHEAK